MSEPQNDNTSNNDRDDLTQIRGIGEARQQWFNETFNVYTFRALADLSVDDIEERTRAAGRSTTSRKDIEKWVAEAAALAAGPTASETSSVDASESVYVYSTSTTTTTVTTSSEDVSESVNVPSASLPATVRSAVQSGSADARAAAADAIPRMREQLFKKVYQTSYYVSYGVVFGSLMLASAVPMNNVMGAGLRDGADAARRAAQKRIAAKAAYKAQQIGGTEDMAPA